MRSFASERGIVAEFAVSSFVFAVALASRLYGIESRSLWMDEDEQARRVLEGEFSLDLVRRAATQQQPPIDYFAQHFGFELFGVTPLGARVHAAIFGALAVVCFYRFSKRVFGGGLPVVFGTGLMLLHPVLLYYSQEARPISCGVFFATLFLSNLHGFVMLPGPPRLVALRGLGLFASTWCFLLSLGMQPVVLIAALALALFPGVFSKSLRLRVASAWAIFAAAFGLAWPVLSAVIGESARYVQQAPLSDRLLSVLAKLAEPPFSAWQFQLGQLLAPLWPPVLVLIALGLWGLVRDVRQQRSPATLAFTAFCLLGTLIFPWLLGAIFEALVKWPLKLRYFATLVPIVLMLLALLLHHALPVVLGVSARSRRAKLAMVATLVAWLVWTGLVQARASVAAYKKQKQNWAALYTLFKKSEHKGVSYMLGLRDPVKGERGYYARRFYYEPIDAQPVKLRLSAQLLKDFKRAKGPLSQDTVYVTLAGGWPRTRSLERTIEDRVPGARFHTFEGMSVVELAPSKQNRAAVRQLFEVLAATLEPLPDTWRVLETLAWFRLADGDPAGARELVLRLKKLDSKQLNRSANGLMRAIKKRESRAKHKREGDAKPKRADRAKQKRVTFSEK